MVNWILIILVVIALVIFFKTTGVRFGKTWTVLIGVAIFFFVITFGFIVTRPDIDVATFDGFISAFRVYFAWLDGIFDNVGGITSDVTNTDWTANFTDK